MFIVLLPSNVLSLVLRWPNPAAGSVIDAWPAPSASALPAVCLACSVQRVAFGHQRDAVGIVVAADITTAVDGVDQRQQRFPFPFPIPPSP